MTDLETDLDQFRSDTRAWLEANIGEYRDPPTHEWNREEFVRHSKIWQAKKHAAAGADGRVDGVERQACKAAQPAGEGLPERDCRRFIGPTFAHAVDNSRGSRPKRLGIRTGPFPWKRFSTTP